MALSLKTLGYEAELVAGKLKEGWGVPCVAVLEFVLERCLPETAFKKAPGSRRRGEEEEEEEEEEEGERGGPGIEDDRGSDDGESSIEDEVEADRSGEEEEDDDQGEREEDEQLRPSANNDYVKLIDATVDPVEWRIELERVCGKLGGELGRRGGGGGSGGGGGGDSEGGEGAWRGHLAALSKTDTANDLKAVAGLTALERETAESAEAIGRREAALNRRLGRVREEAEKEFSEMKEWESKVEKGQERATELAGACSEVEQRLNDVKEEVNEKVRGSTDSKIVVEMKKGLKKLNKEVRWMEVRLGIVGTEVLRGEKMRRREEGGGEEAYGEDEEENDEEAARF